MVELGECQTVPAPTTPQKKFALTRLFSSSSKKAEGVEDLPATLPTLKQGDIIDLDGFGGEFSLTDGERATLSDLLTLSVGGIVVFTYPKASTPGCKRQACLFRDCYQAICAYGFAMYGLSQDSVKANLNFKTKNNLPYTLICDEKGNLVESLGFKRAWKSTRRGVIVIDKSGKVLTSMIGGPNATVEAVHPVLEALEAADTSSYTSATLPG